VPLLVRVLPVLELVMGLGMGTAGESEGDGVSMKGGDPTRLFGWRRRWGQWYRVRRGCGLRVTYWVGMPSGMSGSRTPHKSIDGGMGRVPVCGAPRTGGMFFCFRSFPVVVVVVCISFFSLSFRIFPALIVFTLTSPSWV